MANSSTVLPYFLYSSGILFREGLEALLVIIALVAGTRETGQASRVRDIYLGAGAAVIASAALAWAVNHFIADNTSDTLEGIFQLLAAATLLYVSSWMTSKSQAKQWSSFIRAQVEAAKSSRGPSIALALTAFLAVMREGAETIVFFQALVSGATERVERHAIALGVAAGAIGLALVFTVLRKLVYRIPIGAFFSVTSVLLYGLAVVFAGQGIASFQESGVISATFVSYVPTLPMLGLFPTIQTLAAQGLLLALAASAFMMPLVRGKRGSSQAAAPAPQAHQHAR
ncbi:MAG TPA: FTR1 family protein [Candidatus Binataceae bacterium]|nr:FTR1 family protein [Candidatus Binataceae bacterium]